MNRIKRSTEKRVAIAFWLVLTVLAIVRLVFFSVNTGILDNSRRVEHSRQVLQEIHATLSALQDAETGQRGFIISGDESFLDPYDEAVQMLPQRLAALRALLSEEPEQLERFERAERLANEKMQVAGSIISEYRRGGFNAAQQRIREGTGKHLMDGFREAVAEMDVAEHNRLNNFALASAASRRNGVMTFGMLTLLDFALLSIAFLTIHRYASQRDRAEAELRATSSLQQLILDSAGNAIITGDEHGHVRIFNRTAERWLGYREEDVVGGLDWPWIDQEEIQQRLEALSREAAPHFSPCERLRTMAAKRETFYPSPA
jgi:CHASE3 domain sensor protein